MSLVFDNADVQLVSTKLIFLWVHNKTNSCNGRVLAYSVNSLMKVLATTETCQNMDWLYENLELLSVFGAFVEIFGQITCVLFTDSLFYLKCNRVVETVYMKTKSEN